MKMRITKKLHEKLKALRVADLTPGGREMHNPQPAAIRLPGLPKHDSVETKIKNVIAQLSQEAAEQGFETFEEANDFDMPEDNFSQAYLNNNYDLMEDEQPVPPQADVDPDEPIVEEGEPEKEGADE